MWSARQTLQTSQSINGPLFELFKSDIGRWRIRVEVEAVRVFRIFVLRSCELFFSVVDDVAPLWVYAIEVLAKHSGVDISKSSLDRLENLVAFVDMIDVAVKGPVWEKVRETRKDAFESRGN